MSFHPRRLTLIAILAVSLALAASGPTLARATGTLSDPLPVAYGRAPAHDATAQSDDRRAVALGTLGAVAAAGAVAAVGYLYRRRAGLTAHYDDGFTPHDPRDRPIH